MAPVPQRGETPLGDISGLKIKWVKTRADLNEVEAENIRKAAVKYLTGKLTRRRARFDLAWARRLHKQMFGDVWKWAGAFRTCDLNIGSPWQQIKVKLQGLLDDLDSWKQSGMPLLQEAALLHHRSVAIHPFLNGNGRWSRMLANIWLRLDGHPWTDWDEKTIGGESAIRQDYLEAIKAADEGDLTPLMNLHRRYTPT